MLKKNLQKVLLGVSLTALLVGCGGGSNDGTGSIDLAEYMPAESMTKVFDNYDQYPGDAVENNWSSTEEITVSEANGSTVIITTTRGEEISRNVINESNITSSGWLDLVTNRYIDLGDLYYDYSTFIAEYDANMTYQCTLEEHLTHFEKHGYSYDGDIYKTKCIISIKDLHLEGDTYYDLYYTLYSYVKKDIGLIAEIGDHCYPYDGMKVTDDRNLAECQDDRKGHNYKFLRE